MRPETLWRDGDGYVSCSISSFNLSPIYLTATAARALLRKGVPVDLPDGYTMDSLDMLVWSTGLYGQLMRVTARQAHEVAQIARTLMDHHADTLDAQTHEGIERMIEIVTENDQRTKEN